MRAAGAPPAPPDRLAVAEVAPRWRRTNAHEVLFVQSTRSLAEMIDHVNGGAPRH